MRLTKKDWEEIVKQGPGVRQYKGLKTLFWNGENLVHEAYRFFVVYSETERQSWEQIVILPNVKRIPPCTFSECSNVKRVIMSDSVKRIEYQAFFWCTKLKYIRLSRKLKYIGEGTFMNCIMLSSIFIPSSCKEIHKHTFLWCEKLIILSVPEHSRLVGNVFGNTALIKASPFQSDEYGTCSDEYEEVDEVNKWVKYLNSTDKYSLHRACSSEDPQIETIFKSLKEFGIGAMQKKNDVGSSPFEILAANPYSDIRFDEKKLIKRYILEMMELTNTNI